MYISASTNANNLLRLITVVPMHRGTDHRHVTRCCPIPACAVKNRDARTESVFLLPFLPFDYDMERLQTPEIHGLSTGCSIPSLPFQASGITCHSRQTSTHLLARLLRTACIWKYLGTGREYISQR